MKIDLLKKGAEAIGPHFTGAVLLRKCSLLLLSLVFLPGLISPLMAEEKPDRAKPATEESEKSEKPATTTEESKKKPSEKETKKDPKKQARREEELQLLKQQMLYAPSTERRQAIHQVERLEEESEQKYFLDTLRKLALEDMDPLVREASVRLLADIKDSGSGPTFLKALEDDMRPVMREALRGIGRIELKTADTRIFELLKKEEFKENDNVTVGMIRTLAELESQIAADFLAEVYARDDTNLEIQRAILLYYGNAEIEAKKKWLTDILTDKNEDIVSRSYAANALGKIKSTESIEPLKGVLKEIRDLRSSRERARHNSLKQQAILALIRLDDKSILPELKAAALDDDASVRLRAVKQIGQLKITEFRDMLEYKAKHEPSRSVKKAAQEALDIMDGKKEAEGDEDSPEVSSEEEKPAPAE
ncbi:MAG: HEAT repeat domain-containing protein [Leptospiraceae bacterium]